MYGSKQNYLTNIFIPKTKSFQHTSTLSLNLSSDIKKLCDMMNH